MDQGVFEDENLRKENRRRQMNKRAHKLGKRTEKSILKSKVKDPKIYLELLDAPGEEPKLRKQVSISEEPRMQQSPKGKDKKGKRKLKRMASDEKSNETLKIGQNPQSEITVSSASRCPEQEDDGNSIISEVDSAFEDQTPAAKKLVKKSKDTNFGQAASNMMRERLRDS
jgi:hypothetical protein